MSKRDGLIAVCLALAMGGAWAGTAYYGGFTGETGIPIVNEAVTPFTQDEIDAGGFIWVPNGDGTFDIESIVGRKKGHFTLEDGFSSMGIPDATEYYCHAGWDVGAPTFMNYEDPPVETGKRLCFGVDLDSQPDLSGVNDGMGQLAVVGIEYDMTAGQWELHSDRDDLFGGDELALGVTPTHFEVRVTRFDGGNPAGSDIAVEYRVDYGEWTYFPVNPDMAAFGITNPLSYTTIELLASSYGYFLDVGADYMSWSIRGPWENVDPIASGAGVPDVNADLDADGDTIPNYVEGAVDTDGDTTPDALDLDSDDDGLSDEDEGWDDPDGDGDGNYRDTDSDGDGVDDDAEDAMGTDPYDVDSDNDGLWDGVETNTGIYVDVTDTGTDPLDPDTDNDGANDGDEVLTFGTNPLDPWSNLPIAAAPVALALLAVGAFVLRRRWN